ncbi:hypothetical protein SSCS72_02918 [Mammaliicoccus sciuri]|uniref:hypothetical protein n=1 Tax=Mammaliicoccus sciuri TaxID=1296 RepID=UPI001EF69CE4|nr:hypothetical protein [Mammaliicoccus sciuri]CAG7915097.1 hypothetical protein SSCS72_02918 [Mammaliicoccus sciuri]
MDKLSEKELNIIKVSEEIKKYPSLLSYFNQNKIVSLKKEQLDNAPKDIKDEISQYGSAILNNARTEYIFANEIKYIEEDYQCELCGNTQVKIIFLVMNKMNGKQFWVGSTCVTEFGFDKNIDFVNVELEKAFNKEVTNYKELIADIITPIIIPSRLLNKFIEMRTKLVNDKKDFVNNNSKSISKVKESAKNVERIRCEIKEYINTHRDRYWIANTEVLTWYDNLSEDNSIKKKVEKSIDRLLTNGKFNVDDISYIQEENHRTKVRNLFINLNNSKAYFFSIHRDKLVLTLAYKQTKIHYDIEESELYEYYKKQLYYSNPIIINKNISRFTKVMLQNSNLQNFFRLCDPSNLIESFKMSDNLVFVDADKEFIYKLDAQKCIRYLNTDMNINNYIKSLKKPLPLKVSKKTFNDYITNLTSYKGRTILNRISGIDY